MLSAMTALSWLLLTNILATPAAATYQSPGCCSKLPYVALKPLFKVPGVQSYCSSKYPLAVVTSTITNPAATRTTIVQTVTATTTVDTSVQQGSCTISLPKGPI
ncbi:uncharacterized protein MYCGRDRAFT_103713 [Zymoseptoria tritici IPO323]|uniref:Uncharacterized protein n=1 Tax=Zymoseptoria tritici (strain CBS 115943 / IPO323) TaxID=336722 RepID=F9X520_ZYMTI|nr:uncharacterized protein MYCGRDRAFT_103713 [Zymoseptoria tritici IPO323]EGP88806.1 hypothetical protein MYCGRDRAFT_103713 [Zymoseptoria tritici IPO323]